MFYAQQVVQDACGTQALLAILMNIEAKEVELGEVMSEFKSFTSSFNAEDKGAAIGGHDAIKQAHNSFAEPELFIVDERDKNKGEKGDAFHFISYVPFRGVLYEIDGLKNGPYKICEYKTDEEWKFQLLETIKLRTSTYQESDFFSLMAMVPDKKLEYEKELSHLNSLNSLTDFQKNRVGELKYEITMCNQNAEKIEKENVRRRHYYVPFLVNLLKVLSEKNELIGLLNNSKK